MIFAGAKYTSKTRLSPVWGVIKMLIQCTKTLLDQLKLSPGELKPAGGYEQSPRALYAWHANLINLDRRKTLVLMNNETRYPVVIYRPKPKDFPRIKELIKKALVTALRMEGVNETAITRYMADGGDIAFSRTASKTMVARLTHTCREIECMQEYLDESSLIQRYISIPAGRLIQKSPCGEKYFYPVDKLIEHLDHHYGEDKTASPLLNVELYQLKVQLILKGFEVWRRVLVPSTFSFRHLHNIIQLLFDWHNCHLHMFEAKKKGTKPKQIVMDDDPETLGWLNFEAFDILQERFTTLQEIFPDHKQVVYKYDFGDHWCHKIVLEGITTATELRAHYLKGKGERPPEDVGGEGGYADYLRIIADKSDPEHESTILWAEDQKERKQSREEINRRLRFSIEGFTYFPL